MCNEITNKGGIRMGAIGGNKMVVKVSATLMATPADGVKVGGLSKHDYKEMVEKIDATSFGDNAKRSVAGIFDCSISLSGNLNPTDVGQVQIRAGLEIYLAFYPQGISFPGTQILMLIDDVSWTAEVTGKQEFSASLSGNGDPAIIGGA
jgi:hypothetical protein